jgi:tetratricopeptide (TPR) repeat protein
MRRSVISLIPILMLAGSGLALADAASRNNEGNRFYQQKRFDDALKKYTDAQAQKPEAPELHYNIGNVLFRKGEYAKAVEEYLRAQAATDPRLAQMATFNRGNALMQQGRLQDAVNAYVQALRGDAKDQDAKRNLELALRLLEQQKKKQQDQKDQKQDQKNQPNPPPQQQPQKDQKDEKRPEQKRPGQMSEEEARQILDAMKDAEKEGIKKHAQATAPPARPPEEDW